MKFILPLTCTFFLAILLLPAPNLPRLLEPPTGHPFTATQAQLLLYDAYLKAAYQHFGWTTTHANQVAAQALGLTTWRQSDGLKPILERLPR